MTKNSTRRTGTILRPLHLLGTSLRLVAGQRVDLTPATNLPPESGIDFFARPLRPGPEWGAEASFGIGADDVAPDADPAASAVERSVADEGDLADFAVDVLDLLEAKEDWGPDVLDVVAGWATRAGYAEVDDQGQFRVTIKGRERR